MTVEAKRDALRTVIDAAGIHSTHLTESLNEYGMQAGFKEARKAYIRKLDAAIREASTIRTDETDRISERVRDLDLAESTDLMIAVMDHIRELRGHKPAFL